MSIQSSHLVARQMELGWNYAKITTLVLQRRQIEPTKRNVDNFKTSVRGAILNPRGAHQDTVEDIVAVMGGQLPDPIWVDKSLFKT